MRRSVLVPLAAAIAVACGNDAQVGSLDPVDAPKTTRQARGGPIDRGVAALIGELNRIDLASLMVFDYVAVNFGLDELAAAIDAAVERRSARTGTVDERLLKRLVDPSTPPPEPDGRPEHLMSDILATALHCDQRPPAQTFVSDLRALAADDNYGTTHALLALVWMDELGCPSLDEVLRNDLESRVGASLAGASVVNDLELERSAFLLYAGRADLIPPGWADRVEQAQLDDGGWGQNGPDSERSWHATGLAVWTLAALKSLGSGIPMLRAAR